MIKNLITWREDDSATQVSFSFTRDLNHRLYTDQWLAEYCGETFHNPDISNDVLTFETTKTSPIGWVQENSEKFPDVAILLVWKRRWRSGYIIAKDGHIVATNDDNRHSYMELRELANAFISQ